MAQDRRVSIRLRGMNTKIDLQKTNEMVSVASIDNPRNQLAKIGLIYRQKILRTTHYI